MSQCICDLLLSSHLIVFPKTKVYGWDKRVEPTDEENIAANMADAAAAREAAKLEAEKAEAKLQEKAKAPLEQKGQAA